MATDSPQDFAFLQFVLFSYSIAFLFSDAWSTRAATKTSSLHLYSLAWQIQMSLKVMQWLQLLHVTGCDWYEQTKGDLFETKAHKLGSGISTSYLYCANDLEKKLVVWCQSQPLALFGILIANQILLSRWPSQVWGRFIFKLFHIFLLFSVVLVGVSVSLLIHYLVQVLPWFRVLQNCVVVMCVVFIVSMVTFPIWQCFVGAKNLFLFSVTRVFMIMLCGFMHAPH